MVAGALQAVYGFWLGCVMLLVIVFIIGLRTAKKKQAAEKARGRE